MTFHTYRPLFGGGLVLPLLMVAAVRCSGQEALPIGNQPNATTSATTSGATGPVGGASRSEQPASSATPASVSTRWSVFMVVPSIDRTSGAKCGRTSLGKVGHVVIRAIERNDHRAYRLTPTRAVRSPVAAQVNHRVIGRVGHDVRSLLGASRAQWGR